MNARTPNRNLFNRSDFSGIACAADATTCRGREQRNDRGDDTRDVARRRNSLLPRERPCTPRLPLFTRTFFILSSLVFCLSNRFGNYLEKLLVPSSQFRFCFFRFYRSACIMRIKNSCRTALMKLVMFLDNSENIHFSK